MRLFPYIAAFVGSMIGWRVGRLLDLFVDDVGAEEKRLESQGVHFIRKQGRETWGGVISTFVDPDGNYAQIIQYQPEPVPAK